uniref:Putative methyl-accepting chemotaxis protein. Metal dependent phosphohydrolase. High conserved in MTB n=1 Tax=Magnetococcus massalia (strain MO-1) TaxID=451514 RepID=A0A1S7LHD8_MAGMO|nr:Putative methyl-accepting chemotaxis protein. Metal dependent phosphohydrolase. High conserved in MTB [Candidatus Magnetococcus massalia]
MSTGQTKSIPFYVGMSSYVVMVLALLTLSVLSIVQTQSQKNAEQEAQTLFRETTANIALQLKGLIHPSVLLSRSRAMSPFVDIPLGDDITKHPYVQSLIRGLNLDPNLFSIYIGLEDGEFWQVVAAGNNPGVNEKYDAPAETHVVVRLIRGNPRTAFHYFLDKQNKIIGQKRLENPTYDPTKRPWYGKGIEADEYALTEAYMFSSSKELGLTVASHLPKKNGVVGVDMTLKQVERFLADKSRSGNSHLMVYDQNKRILAYLGPARDKIKALDSLDKVTLPQLTLLDDGMEQGKDVTVAEIEGIPYLTAQRRYQPTEDQTLHIAVISPVSDFTQHVAIIRNDILWSVGFLLLVFVPVIAWSIRKLSGTLMALAQDADRVQELDFSGETPTSSVIKEIDELTHGFAAMKQTIHTRTESLNISQAKLTKVLDMAISLGTEKDHDALLEKILLGGIDLTKADAGTLYMMEGDQLAFRILRTNSLKMAMGGKDAPPVTMPPLDMHNPETGQPNHANVATHTALTARTVNIADAYDDTEFDFSGTRKFDKVTGYRSKSFLTVPLMPRGGKVLGVLQLLNAQDPDTGEVIPFADELVSFVEALSAQAAVTLENKTLVEAQKALFDSFIRLIAGAIDAKSPYTGGHCERVPELAQMLAEAASDSKEGSFEAFTLNSSTSEEMRVAAWLHDCGKVTTPEYVVDKATKLETIYNRIHEVRMRFEVLHRDASIAYWKDRLAAEESEEVLEERLKARHEKLAEDFAFLAQCNVGGEYMAPDKQERVREIAAESWLRYFDDRDGLSHAELERMAPQSDDATLPVEEKLLADRSDHIIARLNRTFEVEQLEKIGVTMPVPEHLYNLGEIYNLCIAKGTLTNEERYKINEHVVQTVLMLENLPFPEDMQNIAEFAGAHHETMIGTGYPRGLTKDQMSLQARIMSIADIFEALTAADRPYKKPKTLSEAIRIMGFMVKDEHIDIELFHLFLKSGIYKDYADKFLREDQIDEVDVSGYLPN